MGNGWDDFSTRRWNQKTYAFRVSLHQSRIPVSSRGAYAPAAPSRHRLLHASMFQGFLNISNAAKGAVSRSHVRVLINVKTTVRGLGLGLGFRVT